MIFRLLGTLMDTLLLVFCKERGELFIVDYEKEEIIKRVLLKEYMEGRNI
jgi:hypothetical protein